MLEITLAKFLKSRTESVSSKEVLKVIGISRFNQTNADFRCVFIQECFSSNACLLSSLRDSQYDCLKNLKMRHVFKTLELLTDWMREGRFDFCILPFTLKVNMKDEDRDNLRSIEENAEGRGTLCQTFAC